MRILIGRKLSQASNCISAAAAATHAAPAATAVHAAHAADADAAGKKGYNAAKTPTTPPAHAMQCDGHEKMVPTMSEPWSTVSWMSSSPRSHR